MHCKHYQGKTCTANTIFRERRALPTPLSGTDVHCQHHFGVQYQFTDQARYLLQSGDGPLQKKTARWSHLSLLCCTDTILSLSPCVTVVLSLLSKLVLKLASSNSVPTSSLFGVLFGSVGAFGCAFRNAFDE